ncbi:cell adhesion molecule CEACAM21-like [Pempheris klunzingeri]|uniref:cell adhesion molecule CEACAM21-like n=1 Tax=Pempheris klunzingeri TaxID=3127111 RepID=UPI00397F4203
MKRGSDDEDDAEEVLQAAGREEYHDNTRNLHILRIKHVQKTDSAEYMFRLQQQYGGWKQSVFPGVTLVVTGLRVKLQPAVVTEGQRVTLTCITSCPLADNTTYTWSLNGRPLTLQETQNKHLVLDPVSSQHAGNYVCAVSNGKKNIISREKTLTVQSMRRTAAAAAGAVAVLVIIPFAVFLWIRRKRSSSQSPNTEATDNVEQLNPGPVYENLSAQPAEQEEHQYSRVHFSKTQTDPIYSTVQPHQPRV